MAASNSKVGPFITVRPMNELLAVPLKPIEDAKSQNVLVINKSLSKLTAESELTKSSTAKNLKLHNEVEPKPKDSNPSAKNKSLSKLTVESELTKSSTEKNLKLHNEVEPKPKDSNPSAKNKSLSKLTVESELTKSSTEKNLKLHNEVEPKPKDSNPSAKNKSLSKLTVESELTKSSTEKNLKLHDKVEPKPKDSNPSALECKDEIILDDADVLRMDLSQELDASLQCKQNLLDKSRKQIFIGNIPASMKVQYISKFFERYGKINHVKFIRSKNQKTVICFITYDSLMSARDSMESNGLFFRECNLRVSRVGRVRVVEDSTIVVTKLPEGTSNQDLYNLFEICGLIKSQYLVKEAGKLVAYITFELKISVRYALRNNNFVLKGHRVVVDPYRNQRERQGLSNLIL